MVIDIQGFNTPYFTPKEITFISGKKIGHFLIKPPKPFKSLDNQTMQEVCNLENKHFGLRYSDGLISYNDIHSLLKTFIIDQLIEVIYIKGNQKADYLRWMLPSNFDVKIIDMEDKDTWFTNSTKSENAATSCVYHLARKPIVCSLQNSQLLYDGLVNLLPQ